jgi:HPt (histidine-containing phosphotransfer) domain-containing protein
MDVQMPEMDGYETTAEIRRREMSGDGDDGRHTPVIAMTANAMQGDREKALEAGMDDYVAKPVRSEELDEILNRWVSDERETPEPEVPLVAQADDSTSQDSEDPLDEEVLAGLRELGDAELLAELVEVFFEDVPPRLAALREATESGDAESVERVAHTLKGSCGNMGAWRMAQICAELQDTGASGDLARAPELLEQLEAEFGRVRPALEAEVARSRG